MVAVLFSQCCVSRRFEWRHYAACALVLTGAVVVRLDELVVARAPRCGLCVCVFVFVCTCVFGICFVTLATNSVHGLLLVVLQAMLSAATGESRRYASKTNATTQKCTAVFTEKMMKRDRPSLDALVRSVGRRASRRAQRLFALVAAQRGDATRTKLYWFLVDSAQVRPRCATDARMSLRKTHCVGRQMYICGLPIYAGMTLYSRSIADACRSTRLLTDVDAE